MTPSPASPAAVLWDMDGTLVDTEPYWIEAEHALVAEHGGAWSDEDAHALVGNDLLVSAEYIRRHLRRHGGIDLPTVVLVERLLDHVVRRVGEHVPWQPGALELLDELRRAGVPCALVTMSWTSLADAVVGVLPPGTFATVVTGDQVRRGKPDPEPYRVAAERLGVRAADCVALEDSVTGLTSAEAAGALTVAIPHLVEIPPAPGRLVVPSLTQVDVAWLRRLTTAGVHGPGSRGAVGVSEP